MIQPVLNTAVDDAEPASPRAFRAGLMRHIPVCRDGCIGVGSREVVVSLDTGFLAMEVGTLKIQRCILFFGLRMIYEHANILSQV